MEINTDMWIHTWRCYMAISEREICLGSVFVKDFVKWKAQMINSQIIFEVIYFEFWFQRRHWLLLLPLGSYLEKARSLSNITFGGPLWKKDFSEKFLKSRCSFWERREQVRHLQRLNLWSDCSEHWEIAAVEKWPFGWQEVNRSKSWLSKQVDVFVGSCKACTDAASGGFSCTVFLVSGAKGDFCR